MIKNSPLQCRYSGFTLLEILMAVMIFGIIMLTVFSSFRSFMLSSNFIRANMAASEMIASLTNIMLRDFLSLRVSLSPEYLKQIQGSITSALNSNDEDEKEKFRFFADETSVEGTIFSRIRFSSLNHIQFGSNEVNSTDDLKDKTSEIVSEAGVANIIYYVRTNDKKEFELCRSDRLNQFGDNEGNDCDPVICPNITKFKLTYMDIEGDEHTEWDSESETSSYATPVSVSIEMEFNIMDSYRKFSTNFSMPVFRQPVK